MGEEKKERSLIGNPENSIPKFATGVNFNKLENGNIILTFVNNIFPDAPDVLIETIIIDQKHAGKIIDVLKKMIE